MGVLRNVFGPSKAEVWKQLADQVDGHFVDGGLFKRDKVQVRVKDWVITLDTYVVSTGRSAIVFTRMRAPYVNADNFRFTIYRRGIFTTLGKLAGMQDVEIGVPEFDEAFVIKGTDEAKLRALFSDPKVRQLMEAQPAMHLEVRDDEGWFGTQFPEGVDELRFHVLGVVKDIDRLKLLFDLFAEVLHRLCQIGSAYERDPELDLK
jgi:hypothetical protein